MLKMYHRNPHAGSSPDYWANSWDDIGFDDALRLCSQDPLRPVFEKYISKDSLVLEGGCGKGHWVAYLKNKGHNVVGLDFSHRTLVELNNNYPGLSLTSGNVNALPFADNSFDIYYSGGVVEHFEDGCDEALAEARRVLKESGTLLLSVPYYSPMRRILTPFRSKEWKRKQRPSSDVHEVFPGLTYFQYAYTISEFRRILSSAGLRTIETMGYSIVWGLYDLRFLAKRAQLKNESLEDGSKGSTSDPAGNTADSSSKQLVKKLVLGEGTETVAQRIITRFTRWSVANMMMFVCRKD